MLRLLNAPEPPERLLTYLENNLGNANVSYLDRVEIDRGRLESA